MYIKGVWSTNGLRQIWGKFNEDVGCASIRGRAFSLIEKRSSMLTQVSWPNVTLLDRPFLITQSSHYPDQSLLYYIFFLFNNYCPQLSYLLAFVCLLLLECNLHKGRGFVSFTVTFPVLRKSVWHLGHHINTCYKGLRTISYCTSLQRSQLYHRWGLQSHWNNTTPFPSPTSGPILWISCLHWFCLFSPLSFSLNPL